MALTTAINRNIHSVQLAVKWKSNSCCYHLPLFCSWNCFCWLYL